MLTIFISSDLGNLTSAPVTPAPCWRFCFTPGNAILLNGACCFAPGNAILLNGACCFAPGNAVLLNGVSQPHLDTILVQREPCSAGRSLRSPAAFSSVARRCMSCIQTSASSLKSRTSLKSRREAGDFSPARSAGCLCITKQESRRDGALSIEHYRVESRRFEQEPESPNPL
jgi:hypothetical protein